MSTTPPDKVPQSETTADEGLRIFNNLIAGILLYGGLGWAVDHFFHTRLGMPIGIIVGFILTMVLIIKRHEASLTNSSPTRTKGPE